MIEAKQLSRTRLLRDGASRIVYVAIWHVTISLAVHGNEREDS